jgi:hypothetical protein
MMAELVRDTQNGSQGADEGHLYEREVLETVDLEISDLACLYALCQEDRLGSGSIGRAMRPEYSPLTPSDWNDTKTIPT